MDSRVLLSEESEEAGYVRIRFDRRHHHRSGGWVLHSVQSKMALEGEGDIHTGTEGVRRVRSPLAVK